MEELLTDASQMIYTMTLSSSSSSSRSLLGEAFIKGPEHITPLSNTQQIILCLLPILPSLLSIVCSSVIIYLVIQSGFRSPYKRILFVFSAVDIVASLNYAISPFMIPKETSSRYWAFGNQRTCTTVGFFQQFGFTSLWCYAVVSVYFLLTVRFGMRNETFTKYCEPLAYILAIGFPLVTAIYGVVIDTYNEYDLGRGCWVAARCDVDGNCRESELIIGWVFGGLPILILFLFILVNNLIIFCYVRRTTYRGVRRAEQRVSGITRSSTGRRSAQEQRVGEVATQAFLYVGAFLITYIPPMALRVLESIFEAEMEDTFYPLMVFQAVCLPMIGVFNFFIYIRPRYTQTRMRFPQQTRLWALRRSVYGESVRPMSSVDINSGTSTRRFSLKVPAILVSALFVRTPNQEEQLPEQHNEDPKGEESKTDHHQIRNDDTPKESRNSIIKNEEEELERGKAGSASQSQTNEDLTDSHSTIRCESGDSVGVIDTKSETNQP